MIHSYWAGISSKLEAMDSRVGSRLQFEGMTLDPAHRPNDSDRVTGCGSGVYGLKLSATPQ